MTPAEPLTEARIAGLPDARQAAWRAYLARSRAALAADKAALQAEVAAPAVAAGPPHGPAASGGMPLQKDAAWYGTPEALRVTANILSYQTPAGGWGKNADRTGAPRAPGQPFVPKEAGERTPRGAPPWSYVGTIDNGATTTELRFLARVQAQVAGLQRDACRAAFVKGVRYLLAAQYPNGGFPQVYPLQGGYHDAITLNDDAMTRVVELLLDVGARRGDNTFVPAALAGEARVAAQQGIALLLATQQASGGQRTGWGQQFDALTLALAGARNFEPAALASAESAGVLILLMRIDDPSPSVQEAVHAGVAWLRATELRDVAWRPATPEEGRRLVAAPGAERLWSRYYDARTGLPVFGECDRTIHDDVNALHVERRNGYAWFGNAPRKAIERYQAWSQRYGSNHRGQQSGSGLTFRHEININTAPTAEVVSRCQT